MSNNATISPPSANHEFGTDDLAKVSALLCPSDFNPLSDDSTLGRIIAHKQMEIRAHYEVGADELFSTSLPFSEKSFKNAFLKNSTGFIFEIKRASPSKGDIAPDIDIPTITRLYEKHANAISVLTDEHFFGGSFDVLHSVVKSTSKPVLCKDFFIDPLQIYKAREAGADAILLMLSVLTDKAYTHLAALAKSFKMDVLSEVHDEGELNRALSLGADIIGINNRNLKDLSIDLNTTKALAPKIPKGCIIISESGIESHVDIQSLAHLVDGFLIGSAIMGAENPAAKINELTQDSPDPNVEVKICGLTRVEDARLAHNLGATYGGLIFASQSPRRITLEKALEIINCASLNYVGVFMDDDPIYVAAMAKDLGLKVIQLHGSENENYRQKLKALLPAPIAIWQAQRVSNNLPPKPKFADKVLYDTAHPILAGGTGQTFDWAILKSHENCVLAGGINPTNIQKAARTNVNILDVNSGIENAPGIKCKDKMTALFSKLGIPPNLNKNLGDVA
jgi:indole-3-glycerol phosphate synthase/phosphoribosylanthranilate isomerase